MRRQLRQEVAFGCPVDVCGSPYLTYHHFDPPWHQAPHHNPYGIVALCAEHHAQANVGAFTEDQLRSFKADPYLGRIGEQPRGRFNWRREQLVMLAGGNWYVGCRALLSVSGKDVIWLTTDADGYEAVNLDLYGASGDLLFQMRDNDWLVHLPPEDFLCPPAGNSLIFKARGEPIRLAIKFSRVGPERLFERIKKSDEDAMRVVLRGLEERFERHEREGLPDLFLAKEREVIDELAAGGEARSQEWFEFLRRQIEGDDITLCRLTGSLAHPQVRLLEDKMIFGQSLVIGGGITAGDGTSGGISIGDPPPVP